MAAEVFANSVIVADNDSLILGIVRSALGRLGLTIFSARDGLEAVQLAERFVARLVILDLNMPRMNGFCACEQIHRLPGYAGVPIVILTAYDRAEARVAADRAGATQFMTKPFSVDGLIGGIAPLLNGVDQATPKPSPLVWQRQVDPPPERGITPELSQGLRMLSIYRR